MQTSPLRYCLAVLATVGLCLTSPGLSMGADKAPTVIDVALRNNGVLTGQVVDAQNIPKAGVQVALHDNLNTKLTGTVTDAQGNFAFQGVRGGVYQITTAKSRGAYRAWATQTAPPSAQPGVLIVADDAAVRGQMGDGSFKSIITNPLVIGGVMATAIAVPVIVHNSNKESSP